MIRSILFMALPAVFVIGAASLRADDSQARQDSAAALATETDGTTDAIEDNAADLDRSHIVPVRRYGYWDGYGYPDYYRYRGYRPYYYDRWDYPGYYYGPRAYYHYYRPYRPYYYGRPYDGFYYYGPRFGFGIDF